MAESKYSFRPLLDGNMMRMILAVRVPNLPGGTEYQLVKGSEGSWYEETVSLEEPEAVVAAIRRAKSGTLGGRENPLLGRTKAR